MGRVFIRKIDDIQDCLLQCWNEISSRQSAPMRSVLIKPNFINALPSDAGVTTSLQVIDAVICFLRGRAVARIAIGEASMLDTSDVFRALKIHENFRGIEILNLAECTHKAVASPTGLVMKIISVPEVIHEFDCIINIPKMKTHELTSVTLGMKNFFAFLPSTGRKFAHVTDIDSAIVDVYSYMHSIKPIITLIDGTVAMSGKRGPVHGTPVALNTIIAGCNAVGVDWIAAQFMGARPENIRHLALAKPLICGSIRDVEIDDTSSHMRDAVFEFHSSIPLRVHLISLKNRIFKKHAVWKYPDTCTRCGACVKVCPRQCIMLDPTALQIDLRRCVGCLCCCEACAFGAMDSEIRFSWIYTAMIRLKKWLLP